MEIAQEYIKKMGYGNTQVLMVRHTDREHPHMHLILNRVDFDGKRITDQNERIRNIKVTQKLTRKHSLFISSGKDNVKRHRLVGREKTRYEINDALEKHLPNCTSWQELIGRLAREGIGVEFKYNGSTDQVQGVKFIKDDQTFNGSKVDRQFSYSKIDYSSPDLAITHCHLQPDLLEQHFLFNSLLCHLQTTLAERNFCFGPGHNQTLGNRAFSWRLRRRKETACKQLPLSAAQRTVRMAALRGGQKCKLMVAAGRPLISLWQQGHYETASSKTGHLCVRGGGRVREICSVTVCNKCLCRGVKYVFDMCHWCADNPVCLCERAERMLLVLALCPWFKCVGDWLLSAGWVKCRTSFSEAVTPRGHPKDREDQSASLTVQTMFTQTFSCTFRIRMVKNELSSWGTLSDLNNYTN